MTTRVAELEKRVAALEREISSLRQLVEARLIEETLVEDKQSQAELDAAWARVKEQMGIHGEPIGAEKLQARMLASGIKPEDNILSRGIIEMREE